MKGNARIKPAYPATFIETNRNSPGANCKNLIELAGSSKSWTMGFINKRLTEYLSRIL